MKLTTVDDNCRTMKRARHFKIYLNNPSMRAALFAPVRPDDTDRIGHLVKSAIFSQWQHSPGFRQLRYARWRNEGEVDVVYLQGASDRPAWVGEVKWSDRVQDNFARETRAIKILLENHKSIRSCFFTTKTWTAARPLEKRVLRMTPSAVYCYTVGRNITARLDDQVVEDITENAPASMAV